MRRRPWRWHRHVCIADGCGRCCDWRGGCRMESSGGCHDPASLRLTQHDARVGVVLHPHAGGDMWHSAKVDEDVIDVSPVASKPRREDRPRQREQAHRKVESRIALRDKERRREKVFPTALPSARALAATHPHRDASPPWHLQPRCLPLNVGRHRQECDVTHARDEPASGEGGWAL